MRIVLAFALLLPLVCNASVAIASDNPVPLAVTTPTKYSVDQRHGPSKLSRFTDENDIRPFIQGRFRNQHDLMSGTDFHFFPNGKFAIVDWCDICPRTTMAVGDWHIVGNQLLLVPERMLSDKAKQGLERRYGTYEKFEIFVVPENEYSGNTILVAAALLSDQPVVSYRYLERRESYIEWQALYQRLRQQQ